MLVARAALHMWEEPCISGSNGSGTVFFAGCPLHCCYCQNAAISRGERGEQMSTSRLAAEFLRLQHEGAHNINLVTPTHYTPQILAALRAARADGLAIPAVWNTSGYERPETLEALRDQVQIYLTDYKYADSGLAQKYSHAPDYPEVAMAAISKMLELAGKPEFDRDGMMTRGVIVRHLVLPSAVTQSKRALKRLHTEFGDKVIISIMSQYTPMDGVPFAELRRRVTADEYDEVVDYAAFIGVERGFVQEGESASESFIPPF